MDKVRVLDEGRRPTPVTVKDTGKNVSFPRGGLEASLKRKGGAQRQAYAGLRDLMESAVYFDFEPADAHHNALYGQDAYYAAMRLNGKDYGVRIKVDVVKDTQKMGFKDHKVTEIDIAPVVYPAHTALRGTPARMSATSTIDIAS